MSIRRILLSSVIGCLCLTLLTACGWRRQPYVPTQQIPRRVAVMDFAITDEFRTIPRELRGFWLGSRDVYRNENIGRQVGDEVAAVLSELPYVDLVSRADFRYYINGKIRLLETAYGDAGYDDPQIEQMIQLVDPALFGRDLGADIVLAGRVELAETQRNRAVEWVSSRIRVSIDVIDARSGETIGKIAVGDSKNLQTQMRILRSELEEALPEFDRLIGGHRLN